MSFSDLGNIGALASAIAVLASLAYLNIQVRQTHRNQRALLNQAVATRAVDVLRWRSEQSFAALFTRVESGELEFTPTEITQLSFMLRVTVAMNQDSQLQHAVGLVDQRTLELTRGGLRGHLRWPHFRAIWTMIRAEFPEETRGLVDRVMAETPVAQPRDLTDEMKRQLSVA
ncbi:MAG TPA: hypothetical protein VGF42_03550 [Caulobacteraceae bacterium]|jgi:hypothetical protein